ncbi:hypothetical protein FRX31_028744 [Thalictrum thalictroides]|uniref:Uncharacterized protein n=1 Tax=Thalictrum thalictroides TaxID=46969 RepID=A0A7J6VAG9_THATH|nr:hypothetical protein FRX31_028744 [Thalictrum thalictroides]
MSSQCDKSGSNKLKWTHCSPENRRPAACPSSVRTPLSVPYCKVTAANLYTTLSWYCTTAGMADAILVIHKIHTSALATLFATSAYL